MVLDPFLSHHVAYALVVGDFKRNRISIFRDIYIRRKILYHCVEQPTVSDWDVGDFAEDHYIQVTYTYMLDLLVLVAPDPHTHL